jgi:hypothetical protein
MMHKCIEYRYENGELISCVLLLPAPGCYCSFSCWAKAPMNRARKIMRRPGLLCCPPPPSWCCTNISHLLRRERCFMQCTPLIFVRLCGLTGELSAADAITPVDLQLVLETPLTARSTRVGMTRMLLCRGIRAVGGYMHPGLMTRHSCSSGTCRTCAALQSLQVAAASMRNKWEFPASAEGADAVDLALQCVRFVHAWPRSVICGRCEYLYLYVRVLQLTNSPCLI